MPSHTSEAASGGERGEFVLVPREPTEEMIQAGWIDKEDVDPDDIYRAMIAAVPAAPGAGEGNRTGASPMGSGSHPSDRTPSGSAGNAVSILRAGGADWRTVMRNLIDEHDKNICLHEETHRGGAIWTICDQCGRKWADDQGGFKAYEEPAAVTAAWAILNEPAGPEALAGEAEGQDAKGGLVHEHAADLSATPDLLSRATTAEATVRELQGECEKLSGEIYMLREVQEAVIARWRDAALLAVNGDLKRLQRLLMASQSHIAGSSAQPEQPPASEATR